MTIFIKEMKQSFISLTIWTVSIAFMIVICVFMFPEMKGEMSDVTDIFANMGGFTAAFGMDKINFGEIMGFYGIECGNILGIGGGFFAAYIGISILAKEEKDQTAEFLFAHPVSRASVLCQKLLSVFVQISFLNIILVLCSVLSFACIGEELAVKEFTLLHLSFYILQLEIAGICFGISAFLWHSSISIGLGLAAILYFANIIRNISDSGSFLKYITPFAYAESSDILSTATIDFPLMILGVGTAAVFITVGFIYYTKKDIY